MISSAESAFVSKLGFPLPLWRYLLVFQSWRQSKSWMIVVLGIVLVAVFGINSFDPGALPTEVLLVSVVCGAMPSVALVMPVEFHVNRRNERVIDFLTKDLYKLGYVPKSEVETHTRFRQALPSYLKWSEGEVVIEKHDDKIFVRGGLLVVSTLRRSVRDSYFNR